MSLNAQTIETKKIDLDIYIKLGTPAPIDGVLCPTLNYRFYQQCMDRSDSIELGALSKERSQMWKNIGIGILAGFTIRSLIH